MISTSIHDIATLETKLSEPPAPLVETIRRLEGDLLILGAGGKMGPTLCEMAMRAVHWTADWIMAGREIWSKPTHYETRDGKF